MTRKQAVDFLKSKPYKLGHLLGFTKLTPLHNGWIIDMLKGKEDKTLQAHRGSYKTTCVSIALTLIIILLPKLRTLFIRKTDDDIKEVISQVTKMLESQQVRYFVKRDKHQFINGYQGNVSACRNGYRFFPYG